MLRCRNTFDRTKGMKHYIIFIVSILAGVISATDMKGVDLPRLALAQESCSDTGLWMMDNVSIEWDGVNSSPNTSRVNLATGFDSKDPVIEFVFKEEEAFYRFFFSPNRPITFSHDVKALSITPDARTVKRCKPVSAEGSIVETIEIRRSSNKETITAEEAKRLNDIGFFEFFSFAKNVQSYFGMFEKYPVLLSSEDEVASMFFMPRKNELAMAIAFKKDIKDITVCRSSANHDAFLFWKIAIVGNAVTAIEYSDKEDFFWFDENADGIPDFCLKHQDGEWVKFLCEQKIVEPNGAQDGEASGKS